MPRKDLCSSDPLTPACHRLLVGKHLLSVQWRGSDSRLQRCAARLFVPFFFVVVVVFSFFSLFVLESQSRALWERLAGLQGSHREGILLPVTVNRKPPHILNPPKTFDVTGVTQPPRLRGT